MPLRTRASNEKLYPQRKKGHEVEHMGVKVQATYDGRVGSEGKETIIKRVRYN